MLERENTEVINIPIHNSGNKLFCAIAVIVPMKSELEIDFFRYKIYRLASAKSEPRTAEWPQKKISWKCTSKVNGNISLILRCKTSKPKWRSLVKTWIRQKINRKNNSIDRIAVIPLWRVADFIKGEEENPIAPCKFVRKTKGKPKERSTAALQYDMWVFKIYIV